MSCGTRPRVGENISGLLKCKLELDLKGSQTAVVSTKDNGRSGIFTNNEDVEVASVSIT
jgi:hypothetical protein